MNKKRRSFLGNMGWGLVGDIVLFASAILLMGLFAIPSLSNAYLIALPVLVTAAMSFILYRKFKSKSAANEPGT